MSSRYEQFGDKALVAGLLLTAVIVVYVLLAG